MATGDKDPGALLTIGELSRDLGVAQHILRYWESRFPQLKPMQRAGNRRYYRPADVVLAKRIDRLLNHEGYTVRGVQKLLRDSGSGNAEHAPNSTGGTSSGPAAAALSSSDFMPPPPPPPMAPGSASGAQSPTPSSRPALDLDRLVAIRDRLARLIED